MYVVKEENGKLQLKLIEPLNVYVGWCKLENFT